MPALVELVDGTEPGLRRTLYENPYVRMRLVATLEGEDLVRVMSRVLAGDAYSPGWESDLYRRLDAAARADVNRRVDAWFGYETGVDRPLDPDERAEMPLVRHWLRMRDVLVESDLLREEAEEEEQARTRRRFEASLGEAVSTMEGVDFGSGLELPPVLAPGSRSTPRHWSLVRDAEMATRFGRRRQGMLVYEGGATPAAAVDELFAPANLETWALDCGEFVQAAHLYARRHALGSREFNEAVEASGGVVTFRLYRSTGYRPTLEYSRSSPSARMRMRRPWGESVAVDTAVDALLAEAPVGSRIVWRNVEMEGTDFFNENAVKVGRDRYAAHGFEGRKTFTRAQLERALAELSYEPGDGPFEAYRRATVFVRKIEHVAPP